jgi:hypothetical protein
MMHQLLQVFFPRKSVYVLVDGEGRVWSHPRKLTPRRAEQLNRRIRSGNSSDLRWINEEEKRRGHELECE